MILTKTSDVGRLVRQRRHDIGMSQIELAERSGITRQLLSRVEQGKSDLSLASALRIMRELSLSLDVRTRQERAEIIEIRIPRFDVSAIPGPRLDAATLEAMRKALATLQSNRLSLPADVAYIDREAAE